MEDQVNTRTTSLGIFKILYAEVFAILLARTNLYYQQYIQQHRNLRIQLVTTMEELYKLVLSLFKWDMIIEIRYQSIGQDLNNIKLPSIRKSSHVIGIFIF